MSWVEYYLLVNFSARGDGAPRYRKESYRSEKNKASVRITTPSFLW